MTFFIICAVIVGLFGILATWRQSPNSSPQSVASRNALERGRFFSPVSCASCQGRDLFRKDRQASGPERPLLLSVLDRINKQAVNFFKSKRPSFLRQLPGPAGFQKGQTSKRFASPSHAGPAMLVCPRRKRQARQLPGPAGTVLERTDKQASVLGRRTRDSSTKKGYPKIALSH